MLDYSGIIYPRYNIGSGGANPGQRMLEILVPGEPMLVGWPIILVPGEPMLVLWPG